MGWIDALKGKRVAIDTAPFIYFIEKHPRYVDLVRVFIEAVNDGEITAFTSVMILLETLVVPLRRGDQKLVQHYRDILSDAPNFTTVPFVSDIAEEAARLRAVYNIRTQMPFKSPQPSKQMLLFFLRTIWIYQLYQSYRS